LIHKNELEEVQGQDLNSSPQTIHEEEKCSVVIPIEDVEASSRTN
jgi:hypothetical protein